MLFELAGQLESKSGSQWILLLVETMRAEWGCSLRDALFKESLAAALVLWPSMLARHGAQVTFDYGDKARQRGKERMRSWIHEHYTIDKTRTPPPPWRMVQMDD